MWAYSCDILCTVIEGPCCLMSIVLLITPAIIPSVATGESRERVVPSARGLMWNLADSLWKKAAQVKNYMWLYMWYLCVCVCVCVHVCMYAHVCTYALFACACLLCVCSCLCMCMREWECVWEREREREREMDVWSTNKMLTLGLEWMLNNLQDIVIILAKWFKSSRRAWIAWQGISLRAEYCEGTVSGTAMFVMPLTGRVVLQAAQCLTPAVTCFSPLPDRASMSFGEACAEVESTPYWMCVCGQAG